MSRHRQSSSVFIEVLVLTFTLGMASYSSAQSSIYVRTNLVSDIAGVANFTDPNLLSIE
jgi:hypothetical protein